MREKNSTIFYGVEHGENGGFDSRAKSEQKGWEDKGHSVKLFEITSEEEFVNSWKSMNNDGKEIVNVSLYFHSNPYNLIIDYTKEEYITANPTGKTREDPNASDATYIGELEDKDINTIYLFACNSAHQDHKEGNLARTFMKTINVTYVYGWDGSMRWGIFNGKPKLASDQHYFSTWLTSDDRQPLGLIKYSRGRHRIIVKPV